MSHIPNAAIPHAQVDAEALSGDGFESRYGQVAQIIREHPVAAGAIGAAVAAGVAAAAIPALRARRNRD